MAGLLSISIFLNSFLGEVSDFEEKLVAIDLKGSRAYLVIPCPECGNPFGFLITPISAMH